MSRLTARRASSPHHRAFRCQKVLKCQFRSFSTPAWTLGAVLLDGMQVDDPGPDRAVVFQNHSLLPWLSAYDNVRLWAVNKVFAGS